MSPSAQISYETLTAGPGLRFQAVATGLADEEASRARGRSGYESRVGLGGCTARMCTRGWRSTRVHAGTRVPQVGMHRGCRSV